MKIHLLSDLHLEFQDWTPPATDADVVVLAGDIHLGVRGVEWAKRHFTQPVVYVPGNHEFYKHNLTTLPAKLREAAAGSVVRVLMDEAVVLDGVRFLGATLWTDFALDGCSPEAMRAAQQEMTDYQKIRIGTRYHRARPVDTRAAHLASRSFLKASLAQPFDGPTVVVSHHAPSRLSVAEQYRGDVLSAAYASELDDLFGPGANLWLHGHMHHSCEYAQQATRVACNPRGYAPKDVNPDFIGNFVISL